MTRSIQQSVGIAFAVAAALPTAKATTTGANAVPGYEANSKEAFKALTFIKVGELSEVPDLTGEYEIASFTNLTTGVETKFADVHRAGEGEIKLGLDLTDTGQIALETAAATGASMSLRFTLRNDTIYYRKAIIKSFKPSDAATGNVLMASVSVAFFDKAVKDAG